MSKSSLLKRPEVPANIFNQPYEVCFIVSDNLKESILPLRSALQLNYGFSGLFYTYTDGVDIKRFIIPGVFTCYDLNTYFNPHCFNSLANNAYVGPEKVQKILQRASAVIIFSDDEQEISNLSAHIITLSQNKSIPFIFAATSEVVLDMNHDERITDIITYSTFNTIQDATLFWEEIRNKLDYIAKKVSNPDVGYFSSCTMI